MSDSKKPKFKVGDIVAIKPPIPWIKWPELNMVVKQGTEGEIIDINQRLELNGGDFDYRVKFPEGIGRLEEDTIIKIGEVEVNKSVLNKNNRDSVGKKDKAESSNWDVEEILQKVEQLGKEFHKIIPIGDKTLEVQERAGDKINEMLKFINRVKEHYEKEQVIIKAIEESPDLPSDLRKNFEGLGLKEKCNETLKSINKLKEHLEKQQTVMKKIEEDPDLSHLRKTAEDLKEKLKEERTKIFQEKLGMTEEEYRKDYKQKLFNVLDILNKIKESEIGDVETIQLLTKFIKSIKKTEEQWGINGDIETLLPKFEQLKREFLRIIPIGDKDIIIKDGDEN